MSDKYAPSSAKRKIASLRAFSNHVYLKNRIDNPFTRIDIKIKEPKKLPKVITHEDLMRVVKGHFEMAFEDRDYIGV